MRTLIVDFREVSNEGMWIATLPDDVDDIYEGEMVLAYDPDADVDMFAEVQWVDNRIGLALIQPSAE